MAYGMTLFAQTSSIRSFFDCQIPLLPILIMFAVLVVITFAGDGIARCVKKYVGGHKAAVDRQQSEIKENRERGSYANISAAKLRTKLNAAASLKGALSGVPPAKSKKATLKPK